MLSDFKIMLLMGFDMHEGGHLTALGWTSFAFYMVAALLSFRAAIASRQREPVLLCRTWSALAVVLLGLGFNKPLDLQTRLIEFARHVVQPNNIQEHHRLLQAVFFLGVTLGIIVLLAVIAFRFPGQIKMVCRQLPLATGGFVILCAYILIRAASINHVDHLLGLDLKRFPFWLLEVIGLILVSIQALGDNRPAL